MKQVLIDRYGSPEDVVRCAEVPEPGPAGPEEILFDVLAFPVNPADIWFCKGSYLLKPALPATPGAECVGRVVSVGEQVTHLLPGDLVINLQRENWTQRRLVPARDVIKLPAGIEVRQAAMLRINPPTALLLLSDVVSIRRGEWVIQNAANSAVGRLLVRLAQRQGLRTVNVVRRESLFTELKELGADVCVVDGPGLAERVVEVTHGAAIRLAVDAVSGLATGRISECLVDGGTLCVYGSMTGDDPVIPRAEVIYRGINLTGFMLSRFLARRSLHQVRELYADLAEQVAHGSLAAPVAAVYPIEEIRAAVRHAQMSARGGKILVAPNGNV